MINYLFKFITQKGKKAEMKLYKHRFILLLITVIFIWNLANSISLSLTANCSKSLNGCLGCSCPSDCCNPNAKLKQSTCDSLKHIKSFLDEPSIVQESINKFLHNNHVVKAVLVIIIDAGNAVFNCDVEYAVIPRNNNFYITLSQYRSPPIQSQISA